MRKWITLSCVLLLGFGVLIFFIVPKQQDNPEETSIMQMAIYPTGTSDESYYYVLDQAGTLKCTVGTRRNDNIKQRNFLKKVTTASEKQLTESHVKTLTDMAKELEIKGCAEKQTATDSWEVALLYNDKIYEMNYWNNENSEEFLNLVNKVIELSPIPVDLHGWA